MNSTPTTPNPERTTRLQSALDELLDMGMDIARTLHRRITVTAEAAREAESAALPPIKPAQEQDLTLQFDRVARAVRRTVALSRALEAPQAPATAPDHTDPRTAARKRIIREVEDTIHDHAEGGTAEHLRAELAERLDAADLDDDIATRPLPEIIADITRDLGIAAMQGITVWKRRAPAELAHLAARAAHRPGDPPLPERGRTPQPPSLGRSRRFHIAHPPPLIQRGLAILAEQEAAPLLPSLRQEGAGCGFIPNAETPPAPRQEPPPASPKPPPHPATNGRHART